MLDPAFVRDNPDRVREGVEKRGMQPSIVDEFLEVDEKWREAVRQFEEVRAEKKQLGKDDRERATELKEREKEASSVLKRLELERDRALERIPNIPEERVPVGKDEGDNKEIRKWGDLPSFGFEPKDYLTIAGPMIDTERAARVSGSRFGYLVGDVALLEFALVKYAFDKLLPYGFIPVVPPVLIKPGPMRAMGKVKFIEDGDAYYIHDDDLYLVGTAEDTLGPMHMGETMTKLPRRYVGFSTAFRREAGSYGKDTKGILRVHQFDKVEMFSFTDPDESVKENDFLLERQEELVQGLGLPYRVVHISTGDMGFTATNQYDIEVWIPSEKRYRETHSCSNTADFQSRGLGIKNAKGEYVHMLNATAFAIGRTLIAIIENYQTESGSVKVPEALREYAGKSEIKAPETG